MNVWQKIIFLIFQLSVWLIFMNFFETQLQKYLQSCCVQTSFVMICQKKLYDLQSSSLPLQKIGRTCLPSFSALCHLWLNQIAYSLAHCMLLRKLLVKWTFRPNEHLQLYCNVFCTHLRLSLECQCSSVSSFSLPDQILLFHQPFLPHHFSFSISYWSISPSVLTVEPVLPGGRPQRRRSQPHVKNPTGCRWLQVSTRPCLSGNCQVSKHGPPECN